MNEIYMGVAIVFLKTDLRVFLENYQNWNDNILKNVETA